MTFGERVRELRKAAGLTQRQLGRLVGLHFTYLSKVERGHEKPGRAAVRRIAERVGADPVELLALLEGRDRLRKVLAMARALGTSPFDWEALGWIGDRHFLSGGTVSRPVLRAQALRGAAESLLTELYDNGWVLVRVEDRDRWRERDAA